MDMFTFDLNHHIIDYKNKYIYALYILSIVLMFINFLYNMIEGSNKLSGKKENFCFHLKMWHL